MKIPVRKVQPPDEAVLADMALAPVIQSQSLEVMKSDSVPATKQIAQNPVEARTDAVNILLSNAYSKASQLVLTDEESKALAADFPDCEFYRGAAGKDDLLYINHASLRVRLNQVIGIGKWNMIVRRSWSEEFTTAKKEQAVRVYVEGVLIIRGCFVSEAVGDGTYYKNNASQNYGDALEAAKSGALRRVCKELGIGLQPFSKDFCEQWKNKYKGFQRPTK